jgi:hypothetical protein
MVFVCSREERENERSEARTKCSMYTCSKSMPWQAKKERGSTGQRKDILGGFMWKSCVEII